MQDRLWTKGFILLIAVQTVDMLTYYMVAPVIAKYAIEQGVVVALSGLAATMFAIVSVVARPVSGVLSDRMGRKRIVVAALAVSCLAQVGYAFVPSFELLLALRAVHGLFYALFVTRPFWGKMADKHGIQVTFVPAIVFEAITLVLLAVSQQLWLMLLAGFLKAGGTGGVLPAIQAQCAKEEPERTGVAMSMYYLGGDIGYTIGPLIGGMLLDAVGEGGLFWAMLPLDALAGLVFVYLAFRMRKERNAL